jgi:hypothetical protein
VVSGSPFSFHSRPIAYKLEKNFEIALT